ncbi:MAG: TIGR02444 family protein [SAR86 cluster bacterium]|uniref:TIGR02444 family protein n=1 Tax=SAR86 cluster bacterium TaxID=2030880 RepID=A0A2A4MRX8_9GAMM|nr:MAG: TIGR02444 family protein [SAR86 cluster bacterium]
MKSIEAESFWDFSVRVYALPTVANNCLALQDDNELDVNLILLAYWHGLYFGPIETSLLQSLIEYSNSWSTTTVTPLRRLRQRMKRNQYKLPASLKQAYLQLRESIKMTELAAERAQQYRLESLCEPRLAIAHQPRQKEAAQFISLNLRHYLDSKPVTMDSEIKQRFMCLFQAIGLEDSAKGVF